MGKILDAYKFRGKPRMYQVGLGISCLSFAGFLAFAVFIVIAG